MKEAQVLVEERPDSIRVELRRPERRNAIGFQMMEELEAVIHGARGDGRKPLVVTGSAGWFASGGDIREFGAHSGRQVAAMAERMAGILRAIEDLSIVTIAVLNGPAIGGGAELALAFDFRLAHANAYLRYPETHLGVTTGWQGAERLARAIGYSRALELLLTARRVDAREALSIGLVNGVWSDEDFEATVGAFLSQVARSGEAGLRVKALLAPLRRTLSDGRAERDAFAELWERAGRREAMEGVLQKGDGKPCK